MNKPGWEIIPMVPLPKGYELFEDTTALYLYTAGGEWVATFTHHASPYTVEAEAVKHKRQITNQ